MLGDFTSPAALVALSGLLIAIALQARRFPGAILWAILIATAIGIPLGVTKLPASPFAMPSSLEPVFGHVDLVGAINIAFLPYLFVFFAAEFFSTMGTTLAVGGKAGLLDEHGNMKNINRPFVVDSIAAALGPIVGIPAATALIESSASAEAGGKNRPDRAGRRGDVLIDAVIYPYRPNDSKRSHRTGPDPYRFKHV
ncbi:Putative permease yicO [Budvicia aquatica]|uniref:Permease yicO n=1 Tax=Budvicia aquatica TaxID=82979 RepID=A0A484ZQF9_9GAMM|nr:Putative permease yicO [Budvicia aquatica]